MIAAVTDRFRTLVTSDYNGGIDVCPSESDDLDLIADVPIKDINVEHHPDILIFPDSFEKYDRDFGNKRIFSIDKEKRRLETNSIVGFIGRNSTQLSIHSRFTDISKPDFFLHYMLQKVAGVNLLRLSHSTDEESVFDFLLYLFPLYLKKAVSQGIFRQYIPCGHNDSNVRGPIRINAHIRHNIPFNGRIAYSTREYSYDNYVTQLVRHTIEFLAKDRVGAGLLGADAETSQTVSQIVQATPSYSGNEIHKILGKNVRPVVHPYYSEYTHLQQLCVRILRRDTLKYGWEKDEIYGLLIDAAWLWEEYLAVILKGEFDHYKLSDKKNRFYLFSDPECQRIIPDYLSTDRKIVADAKYIPLDREWSYDEEKATAIYYKTITYMYRFGSDKAFLMYPCKKNGIRLDVMRIGFDDCRSANGGEIIKIGMPIPSGCNAFTDFVASMKKSEQEFINMILNYDRK